jgi:transposase-like protein
VARLLERAYAGPLVGDLVRALFIDALDRAAQDGRSVGKVARELGIGRRTAWRWIHEMERERLSQSATAETGKKQENASLSGITDEDSA